MAIKEFLNTEHVFRRNEFNATFPDSKTDANLLARAVSSGKVERVRHGLYVSKSDGFRSTKPSPFDIGTKAVHDAVFCYLSALQLHGLSHNLTTYTQFYTKQRIPSFKYDGQEYKPLILPLRNIDSQKLLLQNGKSYRVTSREQTIVDVLYRISLAGGPENVLRSLSSLSYIDAEKTATIALDTNQSTCARLGWVLGHMQKKWSVSDDALLRLHKAIGSGSYYFYSSVSSKNAHWANEWKLLLPYPEKEMVSWLEM